MSDDIVRYRNIVMEAVGGFDPQKILSHLEFDGSRDGPGVSLGIRVNQPFWGEHITIDHIGMFVGTQEEDGYYNDGDLAVHYTINQPSDEDEPAMDPDTAMDIFYSEESYDDELRSILMGAGFSQAAANGVGGSESGMQDEERASYDAYDIADEVRKAIASVPSSALASTIGIDTLQYHGFDPKSTDFESKKDDVIRWLLERIKESGGVPFDARVAVAALHHSGIKWPELVAIQKSFNSAGNA
jgi:hypothetical protein